MDINYFKRTFKFSEDTSIPLYEQLTSYIKIQIQAGVLKPGDKMITENELCEILNVSRTTVRQSMNKLVEQKFIYRYRGKGSFIADQKVKRAINYLYNFTEDMRKLGTVPSSIVLKSCQPRGRGDTPEPAHARIPQYRLSSGPAQMRRRGAYAL